MEVAIIIVKNKKNQFYVHKRSPDKKRFPNLYGLGAGGKIDKDESPEVAAKRELFEELELNTPLKFLFKLRYTDGLMMHVFLTFVDEIMKPCQREFSWSGWLSTEETNNLMFKKEMCPDTEMFYRKYRIEFEGADF